MRIFFKGKKMWGYVSEIYVIPRNTDKGYVALIDVREANNAKIITQINNSVKQSIGIQLAKYETTKDTSFLPEEYKYLEVLLCYDRSLRSIGFYKMNKIKGMWCLY